MDGTTEPDIPKFEWSRMGRRNCDCCYIPKKTDYWHLCLDCDFSMCEDCFQLEHVRNPGHRMGRGVRAMPWTMTPHAGSSQAVQPTDQDDIVVLDASAPSRDKWRCCFTCFNFTPDFISSYWNGFRDDSWHSARESLVSLQNLGDQGLRTVLYHLSWGFESVSKRRGDQLQSRVAHIETSTFDPGSHPRTMAICKFPRHAGPSAKVEYT